MAFRTWIVELALTFRILLAVKKGQGVDSENEQEHMNPSQ